MINRIIRLPPVLFLVCLILGSFAQKRFPLSIGLPSFGLGIAIGSGILIAALGIALAALRELKKHRTTAEPGQRPAALVTSGVFSFTRNPMYVSLLLILLSLSIMADALWIALATPLLWSLLDRFVIRAEEQVLQETFPEDFLAYMHRVRRWV